MTIRPEVRQDPFRLLAEEHARLRGQIRRTMVAVDRPDAEHGSHERLRALCRMTRKHMEREEIGLYPMCERIFGTEGAVSVLRADHAAIRALIARLDAAAGPGRRAPLEVLATQVAAHAAREERVLFPMISALLSGTEMHGLGRQIRAALTTREDAGAAD